MFVGSTVLPEVSQNVSGSRAEESFAREEESLQRGLNSRELILWSCFLNLAPSCLCRGAARDGPAGVRRGCVSNGVGLKLPVLSRGG